MNYLAGGALAVALVASASFVSRNGVDETVKTAAVPKLAAYDGAEHFRINLAGDNGSCLITKTKPGQNKLARLVASAGCDDVMPGLSHVRVWREDADGAIELGDAAGDVVARFAVADGAGYESFLPQFPLMSLISLD